MIVRTWNIFHGNTVPPGPRRYVEEMIRLVTRDAPDVVCLQEVPPWALGPIGEWSGMQVYGEIAARPSIGPLPSTVELGRAITDLNPGLLRSGFEGQANAILVAPERTILSRHMLVLNPVRFRASRTRNRTGFSTILSRHMLVLNPVRFRVREARRLGLSLVSLLAWGKERRQCQAVRLEDGLVVANLHATKARNPRIPDTEIVRAAGWAAGLAGEAPAILAGDFNVDTARSVMIDQLDGYTKAGPGIDHVVARGASTGPYDRWTPERRRLGKLALSDHAPVEVEVT